MGSGYPGGLYFGQYSQGGTVPPDTPATVDVTVMVQPEATTILVRPEPVTVEVP